MGLSDRGSSVNRTRPISIIRLTRRMGGSVSVGWGHLNGGWLWGFLFIDRVAGFGIRELYNTLASCHSILLQYILVWLRNTCGGIACIITRRAFLARAAIPCSPPNVFFFPLGRRREKKEKNGETTRTDSNVLTHANTNTFTLIHAHSPSHTRAHTRSHARTHMDPIHISYSRTHMDPIHISY